MNLVIITGIPGTGKSTLSAHLSHFLQCDLISKDQIKEQLVKENGFSSEEDRKKLFSTADSIIWESIQEHVKTNRDLIVDQWIAGKYMLPDIIDSANVNSICIRLIASPSVTEKRYNQRLSNGTRPQELCTKHCYPFVSGISCVESPL